MISLIVIAILSYLVGSFPTSIIVGKVLRGIDIRDYGSGNAGGTNVFRVLGWKPGVFVMTVDVGKGILATSLISSIRLDVVALEPVLIKLLAGIMAILGHIWTVFAGFRGGKGVGTATGVFISLYPIPTLICAVVWASILMTVRIMSVSSMVGAICLPIILYISKTFFGQTVHPVLFGLSILLALLIIFTHRNNLKRLLRGEENRFQKISLLKRDQSPK